MNYLGNRLYLDDIKTALKQTIALEKLKGKRILVLGATGLIGTFLVDCLRYANVVMSMNMTIVAVGRSRERLVERFCNEEESCCLESGWLQYIECDVTELDVDKLATTGDTSVDIIIHAASGAYPKAFRETPVEVMLANFVGTHRVLELARKNPDCRVLYVSSGEVQEEVDHLSVRACYPMSKRAAETLCLSYLQEYGTDVVIARPCHTFGANVTKADNRATAQFIECAVQNRDIVLKSAGSQVRSFAYVADCVSGLLTVLTCGVAGAVYGVAAEEACSIREFAEMCAKAAGTRVVFAEGTAVEKAEATPIMQQIVSNEALRGLGWEPVYTVKGGIRNSVRILACNEV